MYLRRVLVLAVAAAALSTGFVVQAQASARGTSAPHPAPTARPATAAEKKAFFAFAPPAGPTKGAQWRIDGAAVAGPYALVGFCNEESGVMALLVKKHGAWTKRIRGGGFFDRNAIRHDDPMIAPKTAKQLETVYRSLDRGC